MSTNDRDHRLRRVTLAGDALHESLGTHDIEGGDTEKLLRVELAGLLEDLGGDWNSAVHRVGDDEDEGVRAVLGDALDEALHDASVDLEEVIASHAGLACVILCSVLAFL